MVVASLHGGRGTPLSEIRVGLIAVVGLVTDEMQWSLWQ
jgi:hypothetical protein